jgi:hypothetical protein
LPPWARQALDRILTGRAQPLDLLWADPARVLSAAGLTADPWQERLLRSPASRTLLLCSRQAGKSTVAAALALRTALLKPPALVLLLSPVQRQSIEAFRKVLDLFGALGRPVAVVAESAMRLELGNGSRVVALPGTEGTIRGYSGAALLVIDESARVPDPLYFSVRPMLAVSGGSLIALSTAYAKQGWFYDAWVGADDWKRVRVTAGECPRIAPGFLKEEREAMGERLFRREYWCEFCSADDAVFDPDAVARALAAPASGAPLF